MHQASLRNATALRWALGLLFSLLLTAAPSAQSLVNGGSVSGAISTSGGKDTYTFTAQAGEGFQIRVVDVNATGFYPVVTVLDPASNAFAVDGSHNVATVGGAAPRTGTYRVEIKDGNSTPLTGSYRIFFTKAPGANEGGTLPNGSSVRGKIDRGDLDSYTFAIQAGESYQLRFSDTNATGVYAVMRLYDPFGSQVAVDGDHDVAALGGDAQYTGTYTIVLADGNSDPAATGDYELHYSRVPGASSGGNLPNGGIKTGSIDRAEMDTFTFAITAGESYLLRAVDVNSTRLYMTMRLYDPRGCLVTSDGDHEVAALGGDAQFTGVYTVMLADGNSSPTGTGDYTIHYVKVPGANAGGRLSSGGSTAGRVQKGDLDTFTFDITAGQNFQLRATDVNSTRLYVTMRLYDPRGCYVTADGDHEVASLGGIAQFSGTYTLVVTDGNSSPSAVGDYIVYYAKSPSANSGGPLRNSGQLMGSIEKGEIDSYTFAAQAGERFILRVVDVLRTPFYVRALIFDPRGTIVAQTGDQDVAALGGNAQFTGTYTVLVMDGNGSPSATGDYAIHYAKIPEANEGGYILDGVTANATLEIGDMDSFTFRAKAGDVVRITMTDTQAGPMYPSIHLYGPRGDLIVTNGNEGAAVINNTIARDGTHTIIAFDGRKFYTGPYTLDVVGTGYVGNSGCDREGPTIVSGAISARTGFSFTAPAFTRNCTGPSIVIYGSCAPNPILLPASITCGTCGLGVPSIWGTGVGSLVLPPLPPATVGLTFCVQSGCDTGSCLTLSAATRLTIER